MRARYPLIAALLMFSALFSASEASAGPAGGGGRRRPPPVVSVTKVIKRSVRNQLSVLGTVDPYRTSVVSSEIEGRVKSAPVRRGDPVVAGQTVIAALERTDLAINLRILKAELAAAQARLKEREAELKRDGLELRRSKNLFGKQVLDRATMDRATANYEVSQSRTLQARAEINRVKSRIASTEDELSKAVIRAPLTGFLTEKAVEVGQWVGKGGQVGEVIEIQKVLVRAPVSEKQISYVRVGDTARVRFDAIPSRSFSGRISRVIPKADPKSRTFPVEVELGNTQDNVIKAGMFARVFMSYGEAKEAVLIPKDAILIRPRGASVFVFEKDRVREVTFVPGRGIDSFVEVPGGKLQPGMMVVVQGNENLRNGMEVRLRGQGRGRRPGGKGAPGSGRPAQGGRPG